MRVVITRPAADAPAWVEALQAAGHQVLTLPLIEVGPAKATQPLADAWAQWSNYQAVMFVSAQAVRYFFVAQPSSCAMSSGPRCWATGPGTHKALLQAGVPEASIDSPDVDAVQFDSEALWQRVAPYVQAGQPVLIVRGQDVQDDSQVDTNGATQGSGRDWLAQQLEAAGALPVFVGAYERRAPVWSQQQLAQALQAASDGSVWCFSSSQAIQHLAMALPDQNWTQVRCVVTHPRIAQTAQALGFGEVLLSRPSVRDVLRSLECLA